MIEATRPSPLQHAWRRWPDWAPYAATGWSLACAVLGAYWWAGGPGYPFGPEGDSQNNLSILGNVTAAEGAPAVAALGLAGVLVGFAMSRAWGAGPSRAALLGFAVAAAFGLALVIPDYRLLVVVAYTPIFVLGAPFGWPEDASLFDAFTLPVIYQFLSVAGGLAWAAAAVSYARHARDACPRCGRRDEPPGWTSPEAAARWGRWAVYVAVAVPVAYAATRWAWALGVPLGISQDFLAEGQEVGLWVAGAALATVAAAGELLTFGLIAPWGEVFPRWVPLLGGRRVPVGLAVVPALFVAVNVTSAGLMFVRLTIAGGLAIEIEGKRFAVGGENWGALAPELLWPLWGAALAAAALAYYFRRRGRCSRCGRGGEPAGRDAARPEARSERVTAQRR